MLSDLKTTGTTAGKALINWWRAVSIEAFCCAVLWLIGLLSIRVPLAPVWALIAGLIWFLGPFLGFLASWIVRAAVMIAASGSSIFWASMQSSS